jgi:hypothetical protein
VLDVYCILYFPHLLGGFLHICALYMYYICGFWPPDNVCCIFLTAITLEFRNWKSDKITCICNPEKLDLVKRKIYPLP